MHLDSSTNDSGTRNLPEFSGGSFLGHAAELRKDRFAFFRRLGTELDDAITFRVFNRTVYVLNSPSLLHEFLVEKPRIFVKSIGIRVLLQPLAGEGLFTSDGELWKQQRKLMAPLFHQQPLQRYADDMTACAAHATAQWRDGEKLDLARETMRIAMSVVGRTLFGADTFDEADALGEALTTALEWVGSHTASPQLSLQIAAHNALDRAAEELPEQTHTVLRAMKTWLRTPLTLRIPSRKNQDFIDALAFLDQRIQRMIEERRASQLTRDDLLTRLLRAQDERGERMSDKQVRDEAVTLFVAGHETTATALAWACYLLAKNPDIRAQLFAEVDTFGGRALGADDLPKLSLCARVFKETLRIYPPVFAFSRQATESTTVGPYRIPKRALVFVMPYLLHRRPDVFPDPERFDPDRWLPEAEAARPRMSWLPFGAGPRVCIGNHFALMEGTLVLATLAQRFRFEMQSPTEVRPHTGVTLRPDGGMPMIAHLRSIGAS